MSKIKLALDVVQDLRALADSIETLVNATTGDIADDAATETPVTKTVTTVTTPVTSATPVTAPPATSVHAAAAPTTTAPAEPKLTLAELRAFVAERSTSETRPKIKAILSDYGVAKLTELPEENYAALKREVEAL